MENSQILPVPRSLLEIVHYLPEIIGVANGIKPTARLILKFKEYPRFKEILEKSYSLFCTHSDFATIPNNDYYSRTQIKSKEDKISIYASKSKELANKAKYYEKIRDVARFGSILGYPDCCINFYTKHKPMPPSNPDFRILSYERSKKFIFYTNHLLNNCSNYYLISHFPCSYSCRASISYGKELLRIIRESKPLFAEKIEKVLKLPILYWGYNKIVLFDGSCKQNVVNYSKVQCFAEKGYYDKFSKGNCVKINDEEIEILKDGEAIYKIKKENKYDGRLFNFS